MESVPSKININKNKKVDKRNSYILLPRLLPEF